MKSNGANHPIVVWGVCFLWLASMVLIIWALVLFVCVYDMVGMLRLDIVLALSLLSGLIMAPANGFMLHKISIGEKINKNAPVLGCPLWLCMSSVIAVCLTGVCLCAHKIYKCADTIDRMLTLGMQLYRSNPKYKHFMDTIQWAIKCCGLNSYTDWFSRDWYDKIRDYEWDPDQKHLKKRERLVTDSVPLSCCKTGSCVSNYLMEMGADCIHTNGCAKQAYKIVMAGLTLQLILFASVIFVEGIILCCLSTTRKKRRSRSGYDVQQILTVNPKFESSGSLESISGSETDNTDSLKERRDE